jgi:serine/threonine protein kinase
VRTEERAELCGQVLSNRYRIVKRIGLGGTGVVFEAADLHERRRVAIKTLRPCFVSHIDLGIRLKREAEVARNVPHPGIVRVHDQGMLDDGSPFIVMPLMQGESLSRLLLRVGELGEPQVAALVTRVAAILHSAHAAGYVHRDVKPEHILLNRSDTGDLIVHLLDFGVCAAHSAPAEEKQREVGKVFGTPSYVSPEQAAGLADVDARADLFSLGIVMFEALSGRVPFSGSTVSKLLVRIIRADAPRVREVAPQVSPHFDQLVACLLAREPAERFPSARALARALAPYLVERKIIERGIASNLQLTSQLSDTAPTLQQATRRVA